MGFSIPLREWFSEDLRGYAEQKLFDKKAMIYSILKYEKVRKLVSTHRKDQDNGSKIWALLTLELWMESYFS